MNWEFHMIHRSFCLHLQPYTIEDMIERTFVQHGFGRNISSSYTDNLFYWANFTLDQITPKPPILIISLSNIPSPKMGSKDGKLSADLFKRASNSHNISLTHPTFYPTFHSAFHPTFHSTFQLTFHPTFNPTSRAMQIFVYKLRIL